MKLSDFNLSKRCESGFEFEVLDENNKPTGFFITVYGDHAPSVQSAIHKILNDQKAQEEMNARRKHTRSQPIEDMIAMQNEMVACRVASWRGIDEPCTKENVITLCATNGSASN
jgi:hypothetical protein